VPRSEITSDELLIQIPSVEQQVFDALLTPTGHWGETETWLGGLYLTVLPEAKMSAELNPTDIPLPPPTTEAGSTATPPTSTPSAPDSPGRPCSAGALPLVFLIWGEWRRRRYRKQG
jgi:hypothetical protein